MRAHEAGWAARRRRAARAGLAARRPTTSTRWSRRSGRATARKVDDGALEVGGVDVRDLVAEHGTPAYVLDEADFRARAPRLPRRVRRRTTSTTPARRSCARAVARWVAEEGLGLDVCTGGELAVALRGRLRRRRGSASTATTSPSPSCAGRVDAGVGRIVVDSFDEIDRLAALAARARRHRRAVLVRVTVGVEAHTHEFIATAHEDQKFGFSLAGGDALEAVRRVLDARRRSSCSACTPTSARRSSTPPASRSPPAGCSALHAAGPRRARRRAARARPRRRPRHRLHHPGRPGRPRAAGHRADQDRRARVPRRSASPCRGSRSSPAGRSSARPMCTVYEVGTVKEVELDGGAVRTYVSVDGGMSDNIRTALYDADYSCTLASRASDAPPVLARVVGKHCEAGDIVVKDEFLPGRPRARATCSRCPAPAPTAGRWPATTTTCCARRWSRCGTARPRVVVRRETEDDLLRTGRGS